MELESRTHAVRAVRVERGTASRTPEEQSDKIETSKIAGETLGKNFPREKNKDFWKDGIHQCCLALEWNWFFFFWWWPLSLLAVWTGTRAGAFLFPRAVRARAVPRANIWSGQN